MIRVLVNGALWLMLCGIFLPTATAASNAEVQAFKEKFSLQQHSEGGWFAEIYAAPFKQNDRPLAGSIYFLLDGDDVSHFHQIDCDEVWYYHAGCGMKIIVLHDGHVEEFLLGVDTKRNRQPMVVVPAGAIFAAENIDKKSYTFISCMTTPRFVYEGFRLVPRAEVKKLYPNLPKKFLRLAYEKI